MYVVGADITLIVNKCVYIFSQVFRDISLVCIKFVIRSKWVLYMGRII